MKTLELINGDLVYENGDFKMIEGEKEIAQCLSIPLGTNLKEWFLDERFGIDFTLILGKSNDEEARAEVLRVLSQEERVASIDSLTISNDFTNRIRTIRYSVTLIDGSTLIDEVILGA